MITENLELLEKMEIALEDIPLASYYVESLCVILALQQNPSEETKDLYSRHKILLDKYGTYTFFDKEKIRKESEDLFVRLKKLKEDSDKLEAFKLNFRKIHSYNSQLEKLEKAMAKTTIKIKRENQRLENILMDIKRLKEEYIK